jgi:GMP synthase-like glutamine amidotransferase
MRPAELGFGGMRPLGCSRRPNGAYEEEKYAFLIDEIAMIEKRLNFARRTLGICLGVLARALEICQEQAFTYGKSAIASQFHPEASAKTSSAG